MLEKIDRALGGREPDGDGLASSGVIADVAGIANRRSPWEAVQLARNIQRPHSQELIGLVFDRFQELHGDRGFGDDPAVIAGLADLGGRSVVVVAQQKGSSTEENIARSFGMPHPEGYRKAIRLFRLAEKFGLPVITFIDTPGAHPGPEAEERGQAEAIARSIQVMGELEAPVVAVVIGEGGSGGALALGVGDVVLMMQNAVYSVISPEGCAAILWRSASEAERAAKALRGAGPDLLELGVIDGLVPEPEGGAHTDRQAVAAGLRRALVAQLDRLASVPLSDLLAARYDRYREIGSFADPSAAAAEKAKPWWRRALGKAGL
ncbi:MAG: acetyl-CoA carboxylase carboxyltransferase subunit alpha [Chloroflexi bacterium]|nr:acetyl-CoA carboxylase carboxyltransferase subunit alpha [Chloroflexota bacterium]